MTLRITPTTVRPRAALALAALCCVVASCSTGDDDTSDVSQTSTTNVAETTAETNEIETTEVEEAEPEPTDDTGSETTAATDGEDDESTASTSEAVPDACGLNVGVSFRESAPRDSMTIQNDAASLQGITALEIDLTSSAGSIIFDTVEGGTGVEVFQDFQVEDGDAVLVALPAAEDGGTSLRLEFASFEPAQSFTFSIDVDDQLADSDLGQIQVTGAEIAGAIVTFETADGAQARATFDDESTAAFVADC